MERGAERQRGDDREAQEDPVERQWGEAEVLALVAAWDEIGTQHVAENRVTFELISERLRRLSVVRTWRECQAKSRSLGLPNRKPDAAGPNYSPGVEGWEEGKGLRRRSCPSSAPVQMQEGKYQSDTNNWTTKGFIFKKKHVRWTSFSFFWWQIGDETKFF